MPLRFAPFKHCSTVSRREALSIVGCGLSSLVLPRMAGAQEGARALSVGLTPVFLNNDLELLSALKSYLEEAVQRSVNLVLRRTYEEITTLLVSGQLDSAWICGYPFVTFRDKLDLLAVPLWRGRPLYQSYIVVGADSAAASVADLRGSVHAFSDPNSNSGYLVTAALLAEQKLRPDSYFSRIFFTYGHRNVVRAVASGLADSGSVDGYVWEVMALVEPDITRATRVLRKSEWLGFPPVATVRNGLLRPEIKSLQNAFLAMGRQKRGQRVLSLLHLDGFVETSPELFDAIANKADLVKHLG
jgi:phosphonate transport system substrate-binding protein